MVDGAVVDDCGLGRFLDALFLAHVDALLKREGVREGMPGLRVCSWCFFILAMTLRRTTSARRAFAAGCWRR